MRHIMVFLILILVWVAVLGPQYLRDRADARPTDSIRAFRRQLAVLGRTGPATPELALVAPVATAGSRAVARRRRRNVLVGLVVASAVTLVAGLLTGTAALLWLHLVLDALCGGFVALLVRRRRVAERAARTVAYLPAPATCLGEPEELLTSTGG